MIPEDLLFWIAPLRDVPVDDHNVLCRRHADAMVVPRGWTLDDRREPIPRLFMPRRFETESHQDRPSGRRPRTAAIEVGEQLQIDGTGEIDRPTDLLYDGAIDGDAVAGDQPRDDGPGVEPDLVAVDDAASPWQPDFDHDDDLGGLLEVESPLLARAFRGTGRSRN